MKRLKSFFIYAYGIWLLLPVVMEKPVTDYPLFLLRGVLFAAVLALAFRGLDLLWDKMWKEMKGE